MQKASFDEILRSVTPAMIEAGEQVFDYPSDYLGPSVLRENLPSVFAAMVLAYLQNKHREDSSLVDHMR